MYIENKYTLFFDDFTVVHEKSNVVQMDDYYPFGLDFTSYSRDNSVPQSYKYNAKEEQTGLNLGWLDYGARMYMGDIGKWTGMDAKADKYHLLSPYVYAANNPVYYVDPDGNEIIGSDGRAIRFSIDGKKLKFETNNASEAVQLVLSSMALTKTGRKHLSRMRDDKKKHYFHLTDKALMYYNPQSGKYMQEDGVTVRQGKRRDIYISTISFKKDVGYQKSGFKEGTFLLFNEQTGEYVEAKGLSISGDQLGTWANENLQSADNLSLLETLEAFLNALGVHESNHTTDENEEDADKDKDTEFGENGSMHEERQTKKEFEQENKKDENRD